MKGVAVMKLDFPVKISSVKTFNPKQYDYSKVNKYNTIKKQNRAQDSLIDISISKILKDEIKSKLDKIIKKVIGF